jgi:hypothetical protein
MVPRMVMVPVTTYVTQYVQDTEQVRGPRDPLRGPCVPRTHAACPDALTILLCLALSTCQSEHA